MILDSFTDEILKLGVEVTPPPEMPPAANTLGTLVRKHILKRAAATIADEHNEAVLPGEIRVNPADVTTRLENFGDAPTAIQAGVLGSVSVAKRPIDQERLNRYPFNQ